MPLSKLYRASYLVICAPFLLMTRDGRTQAASGGAAGPTDPAPGPAAPSAPSAPSDPGASTGPSQAPPGSAGGTTYVPFGLPPPGFNPDAHLPSSSQSVNDINAGDRFDLGPKSSGPSTVRGSANGPVDFGKEASLRPATVPPVHVVRRGDTLWTICDHYFQNPWAWPQVWAMNPELQNPHWIYPGDQLRLTGGEGAPGAQSGEALRSGGAKDGRMAYIPKSRVSSQTIFLREQGYIDDDAKDVWGEVAGSPDDQLFLSDGNAVYIEVKEGNQAKPGQDLTVFQPLRSVPRGDANRGTLVAILGTAHIEEYNPKTRIARGHLTESIDVIERGAKVGPVMRHLDVVAPVPNQREVWGIVAASLYPAVFYGENQVVYLDRGEQEGLAPGNRLFAITQGDGYRQTLKGASEFAAPHVVYETEKPSTVDVGGAAGKADESKYPDEVVGELLVLRTRPHSAACLVTNSRREIFPGQKVVARKGY